MQTKRHMIWWLAVFLWSGLIFLLSSLPTVPGPQTIALDFVIKKLAHMFEYAVLYYLVYQALGPGQKYRLVIPFVWCFIYASTDEFHQSFTPGRHPSIWDVGFDSLGAAIASLRIQSYI